MKFETGPNTASPVLGVVCERHLVLANRIRHTFETVATNRGKARRFALSIFFFRRLREACTPA
jgi:hypothetical protein